MSRNGQPYGMAVLGTGIPRLDAHDDFRRARRRRPGRRRRALATPPPCAGIGGARSRVEMVPLDRIVGAVEPSPCFDARFRPASEIARPRWERVALAHRLGVALPPIELLECPDGFYVIDGCHRVSVARALGLTDIDARVRRAMPGARAARLLP